MIYKVEGSFEALLWLHGTEMAERVGAAHRPSLAAPAPARRPSAVTRKTPQSRDDLPVVPR